ncbi:MAG: TonB-dependent receptor [Rikenellaceae bacterium]
MKMNFTMWRHLSRLSALVVLLLVSVLHLNAQALAVSGVVVDESGQSVIGANIVVSGTTQGTISDLSGKFSLSGVDAAATLDISYIGMESQSVAVSSQPLNIVLLSDSIMAEEVIVVGYGVQKKSVVTAAIGSVDMESLERVVPTRVDNVLKGQVAGVTVTSNSGQPGDASQVRIRGVGTVNDSDPLYIVDGMPIDGGIDYLNVSDIESIEVLKDAASGAVYGARAANGVILVTTKSGSAGKTVVSYNFSYGWQNPWSERGVLNASEYQTLRNEMLVNSGKEAIYSDPSSAGVGTDWQSELFNYNAPMQNHQLSISGGGEKSTYFASAGYYAQDGIIGGDYGRSNYERFNLRFNNINKVFNKSEERNYLNSLTFTTNIAYTRTISTGVTTNSEYGSPLGSAVMMSPTLSVYAADQEATLAAYPNAVTDGSGNVYTVVSDEYGEITNPLAQLELPGEVGTSDKFVTSFSAELQVWDNIKFKSSFGGDLSFWGADGWLPAYYLGKSNYKDDSEVWSSMNRSLTWQIENVLSYNKTFGVHSISAIIGQSAKRGQSRSLWGKNYGLQEENGDKANLDFATGGSDVQQSSGSLSSATTMASLFTRLDYNYKERYMAQVTVRRDGSSNFGSNNKYATFPSASVGWNVTNEAFAKSFPLWIHSMKLRASWGKNGNSEIAAFRYTTLINSNNDYIFGTGDGESIVSGAKPNGLENPSLKWETSTQTDIGIDLSMLRGALKVTADWYNKRTDGMLMEIPVPDYTGDSAPIGNVGVMTNKGFEFEASYKFNVTKDLNLSVGGNASYLVNLVNDLGNTEGYVNYDYVQGVGTVTRAENGEAFPFFYGKRTDGVFQNQAEIDSYVNSSNELIQPNAQPGDVKFVDINNDGKIDDEDRINLGKGTPDWTYSFNLNAEYKSFDLSIFFQGVAGVQIFDASYRNDLAGSGINMPSYMLDRWTGEGTSNTIPRLTETDENGNWLSSDLYVKNGNYLRLKNIQLGYTLPSKLTKKAFIGNMRVYIAAENLLTFTEYDGFDPEIASGGTSLGVDRGTYPQSKTYIVGANVSF